MSRYYIVIMKGNDLHYMINTKKFAFLGVGNMAGAIIKAMDESSIYLYDNNASQYAAYEDEKYIKTDSAAEAVLAADYILLCTKPQNFPVLLGSIHDSLPQIPAKKTFVSIAAGISTSYIRAALGDVPVIRIMPNTPFMIGRGVSALCRTDNVSDEAFYDIMKLFGSSGRAFELTEDKMDATVALNGSSPAYVYLFIEAMSDAARSLGIERDDMLDIVCDIVSGAAEMMRKSGKTPGELINIVASKGGTTERALEVFRKNNFSEIIAEAMKACADRSRELSGEN